MTSLLYISMFGESDVYTPSDYTSLCPTGLEKDWILSWHGPLAARFGFSLITRDICRGETLPEPDEVAAVILGGTIHLILEKRAWIFELTHWLKSYRRLKKPLLGICGGHQLIATAFFGWPLHQREGGTCAGTYPVHLIEAGANHPLFQGMPDNPEFHFANTYHIFPGASDGPKILVSREDSPALALDYGNNWFSTQFHPESRRETWECFFSSDPDKDFGRYRTEHCGEKFLENYLNIARNSL